MLRIKGTGAFLNETWMHRMNRISVDRSEGAKATDYRGADATTPQQAKRSFERSDTNITDRAFTEPEHFCPLILSILAIHVQSSKQRIGVGGRRLPREVVTTPIRF